MLSLTLLTGPADVTFADRVFTNAMDTGVTETKKHYDNMLFRDALKSGYYDMQTVGRCRLNPG